MRRPEHEDEHEKRDSGRQERQDPPANGDLAVQRQEDTSASLDLLLGRTDRAGSMAGKLCHTAEWVGLSGAEARRIADVFRIGMERRSRVITDDHHPDYLHTARTALILLSDTDVRDPDILLAAVLRDSERPELELDGESVVNVAGDGAAAVLRMLPRLDLPRADQIEILVTAPIAVLTLYIAERLDHMRHLHLGSRERWAAGHEEAVRLLMPLADRCHAGLERRLNRWAVAFQRRFLESDR